MRSLGILICVGILCLIVSDIFAKKQTRNDFTGRRQYIASLFSDLAAVTTLDNVGTDTTLTALHHNVFVDTDSAAVTITLPVGVAGTEYRVVNVGTSTNNVTIAANGSEKIIGTTANYVLVDSEAFLMQYDTVKGWY